MRLPKGVGRGAAVVPLLLIAACAQGVDGGPTTAKTGAVSPAGGHAAPADATVAGRRAINPARLKGMTATEVRAVLGAPGFTRRDAPAEIWQYRTGRCTLDLFVYDHAGGQRVEDYAVRSAQPVEDQDCVDTLVQVSRAPTAG